jgi:NhaC family Na+:H+ antiporter
MTRSAHRGSVSFGGALSVLVFLALAIVTQVFVLDNADATQITLIIVTAYASVVAMLHGFSWHAVQDAILYGCRLAMLPMLILMMVGVLIASWSAAGTIPALIYFGVQLLSPDYFLFSACLVCAIGSLSTGSSWTTAATFGVAFMGIGYGLGVPPAHTAGAVISGSIFGDKMSPLSDSTNLAAGVAQADLFDHIRSMVYSTGPAMLLTLALFLAWGLLADREGAVDTTAVSVMTEAIAANYSLNPVTLLPPLLVLGLIIAGVGGLAVMVLASLAGMLIALTLQDVSAAQLLTFMNFGFESAVGVDEIDAMLSGGGLQNMMWTISLGFVALSMGGVLEETGMLRVILERMSRLVSTLRGLAFTHVAASILVNLVSASQFMALIIPTRMLVPVYRRFGLLPQVCSRIAEDSATVTSPLVPWGLGGVYYSTVLGVATLDYLPCTLLALLAPLATLTLAFTDRFMFREGDIPSVRHYRDEAPASAAEAAPGPET